MFGPGEQAVAVFRTCELDTALVLVPLGVDDSVFGGETVEGDGPGPVDQHDAATVFHQDALAGDIPVENFECVDFTDNFKKVLHYHFGVFGTRKLFGSTEIV